MTFLWACLSKFYSNWKVQILFIYNILFFKDIRSLKISTLIKACAPPIPLSHSFYIPSTLNINLHLTVPVEKALSLWEIQPLQSFPVCPNTATYILAASKPCCHGRRVRRICATINSQQVSENFHALYNLFVCDLSPLLFPSRAAVSEVARICWHQSLLQAPRGGRWWRKLSKFTFVYGRLPLCCQFAQAVGLTAYRLQQ